MAVFFTQDALHAFSTNWVVNLFFAAIFILFGISFFGAFEISLPSSWATKIDSKANTKSFSGIFFMALTLVIVSFSCTVPFISYMLKLMGEGSKIGPLIGFFGYGLGLALPFTLFALFPALLNELGKQGGWLNVVKVTFGFVELALAMKFLSNADIQMNWRLLDREIFIAIWVGLSFLLSAYLLGAFRFSHDSEMPKNDWGLPYLKVPRFLFAVVAFVFGIYLLPGMWGAPLNGMGAFLPPMGTQDFVLSEATGTGAVPVHATTGESAPAPKKYFERMRLNEPPVVRKYHMTVYFDYKEALAASKILKKPVMLDFTGINCANCRKLESSVWSDPEVMRRLKEDFVLASLYCDANGVELAPEDRYKAPSMNGAEVTTLGELNQDLEITKYGTNSLPAYFFVDDAERWLHNKAIFYPISAVDFIKVLDAVKEKYKAVHP
jgi:thiol:disulfide interchange protein DsbD